MDKYDNLIKDLLEKTKNKKMVWDICLSMDEYSQFIFESHTIVRLFEATYDLEGKLYIAVLVEKRIPIVDEYNEYEERYEVEVLIIDDRKLIFTLTDRHIEREELIRLSSYVEEMNKSTRGFLSYFDS